MKESLGSILIIVENLPLPFDRRVWMESNTLKDNGYDISIICPKGKGFDKDFECINGIDIYRHHLPPEKSSALGYIREYSYALFYEWSLARKIYKKKKFGIIQACNPPDLIFLVAIWFKIFHKVKFIFDHHDLNPELYISKFGRKGFFYQCLLVAEKFTFRLADLVISTNESYKEVAVNRGNKNPKDVTVVRSGPDLAIFKKKPVNNKFKNGKKFLVGYLGVMGEFDGVDYLIRAVDYMVNERNYLDIQFCLIGSGPCLDSLKSLTNELKLDSFVEFTGRIPDNELLERLSSCDVCVNPDPLNPLNDKSTMNKILEYMALGKPIVQFNLVEGRRSAEQASLYAEPNNVPDFGDKIITLLEDADLRIRMGAIGRDRMENQLEWRFQKEKLMSVYKRAFNISI
jgi:glycosyltransferase involved in cell wall biosynthesis